MAKVTELKVTLLQVKVAPPPAKLMTPPLALKTPPLIVKVLLMMVVLEEAIKVEPELRISVEAKETN